MKVPSSDLRRRAALVTGVSRRIGIGFAIARRLASEGMDVLVHSWRTHDREQPWGADPLDADGVLAALLADLPAGAGRIEHVEADFLDPAAPRAVVDAALASFGRLDVVVANHARSSARNVWSLSADEVDRTLAVNVRATLLLVQAFAEHYAAGAGGRLILFTSGQHRQPMADELPYIASKAALHQLTPSLAAALAPRGILVNCIDPGPVDTGYADAATVARIAAGHPQGRWGQPEDVARLVAWLVADAGRWVVGQVLVSDGGASLGDFST